MTVAKALAFAPQSTQRPALPQTSGGKTGFSEIFESLGTAAQLPTPPLAGRGKHVEPSAKSAADAAKGPEVAADGEPGQADISAEALPGSGGEKVQSKSVIHARSDETGGPDPLAREPVRAPELWMPREGGATIAGKSAVLDGESRTALGVPGTDLPSSDQPFRSDQARAASRKAEAPQHAAIQQVPRGQHVSPDVRNFDSGNIALSRVSPAQESWSAQCTHALGTLMKPGQNRSEDRGRPADDRQFSPAASSTGRQTLVEQVGTDFAESATASQIQDAPLMAREPNPSKLPHELAEIEKDKASPTHPQPGGTGTDPVPGEREAFDPRATSEIPHWDDAGLTEGHVRRVWQDGHFQVADPNSAAKVLATKMKPEEPAVAGVEFVQEEHITSTKQFLPPIKTDLAFIPLDVSKADLKNSGSEKFTPAAIPSAGSDRPEVSDARVSLKVDVDLEPLSLDLSPAPIVAAGLGEPAENASGSVEANLVAQVPKTSPVKDKSADLVAMSPRGSNHVRPDEGAAGGLAQSVKVRAAQPNHANYGSQDVDSGTLSPSEESAQAPAPILTSNGSALGVPVSEEGIDGSQGTFTLRNVAPLYSWTRADPSVPGDSRSNPPIAFESRFVNLQSHSVEAGLQATRASSDDRPTARAMPGVDGKPDQSSVPHSLIFQAAEAAPSPPLKVSNPKPPADWLEHSLAEVVEAKASPRVSGGRGDDRTHPLSTRIVQAQGAAWMVAERSIDWNAGTPRRSSGDSGTAPSPVATATVTATAELSTGLETASLRRPEAHDVPPPIWHVAKQGEYGHSRMAAVVKYPEEGRQALTASRSQSGQSSPATAGAMPVAGARMPSVSEELSAREEGDDTVVSPLNTLQRVETPVSSFNQAASGAKVTLALPASPSAQLGEVLRTASGDTVDICLQPEELGRVRMQMRDVDGELVLHIAADRPETLDLLRRNMSELVRELRDLGHESVSFSWSDRGQRDGSRRPATDATADAGMEDPVADATSDRPAVGGQGVATDGLNLRV